MKPDPHLDRRNFVKLSALAATAAMLPATAGAADAYKLDALPYAFDALAPHIDAKTMEIHHDKHHASYIKNLNEALAKDTKLAEKSLDQILGDLPSISDEAARTTIRNNGGGHWNHDFFWKTLTPADKSGKPSGELAKAIDEAFGSYDEFKNAFGAAAAKRFGSGWAWLISQNGKLKIVSTANQDNPAMKGIVPDSDLGTAIIGLDVWEHAYYLNYQNKRPEYVAAWWNIVNWDEAAKRYAAK